jgi:hypothetical protein
MRKVFGGVEPGAPTVGVLERGVSRDMTSE